ncbi:MAG: VOC family protein [Candidatus Abyssubacteria bacterium]
MNEPNKPVFEKVDQIGIVVRDVDECVKHYEQFLGEGAFSVVEGEAPSILGDGREVMIKGKLAFAQVGPIQLELIEIRQGPSLHLNFLEKQGEGIHHLGMYTSTFDKDVEEFRKRGVGILQQGQSLRRYAYMDTKPFVLELIENV